MDSIISLGTSTTLLLTTKTYKPSPSYHIFNHPTTKGLYFAMLCYKNGSLAREEIRNKINGNPSPEWDKFNSILSKTNVLGGSKRKLGFYFQLPEIIPDAPNGTWRFTLNDSLEPRIADATDSWTPEDDVRAIVESQALFPGPNGRVRLCVAAVRVAGSARRWNAGARIAKPRPSRRRRARRTAPARPRAWRRSGT